ncbi:MAG: glycosyltransferase [Thermoanaerobaculia bacterium]
MSPRLRVVFLTYSLAGGGAERQLLHLLHSAWPADIEPVLLCMDRPEAYVKSYDALPVRWLMPPDTVLPLDQLVALVHETFDPDTQLVASLALVAPLTSMLQQLADGVPTILISPLFDLLPAAVLARSLLGAQIPIVGIEQVNPSHFFRHELDLPERARIAFPRVLRAAYAKTDRIVAVSRAIRDTLVRDFDVDPERIECIPNAVALEKLEPRRPSPTLTIAAMGRLHPVKRYDFLLRSAALLRHRSNVPFSVVILGQGAEQESLERLARDLGIASMVRLPGFDPSPWKQLAAADIFAHTSATEAQPLAILEAMGMGFPVVTTRWDGVNELVIDGVNGFVTDDDPDTFADALARLAGDARLRARMGRAGSEKAREFDLRTSVFPKYLQLVQALAPRAVPVPRRPVSFSPCEWAGRAADPIRLVAHHSYVRELPSLGFDCTPLVFDEVVSVRPPLDERYLIVSRRWPDMIDHWRAAGGPVPLHRAALLHST